MHKNLIIAFVVIALMMSACSIMSFTTSTVEGSGNVINEPRSMTAFNSVELRGSADVNITFGNSESVSIEADDNILPLIVTSIQNQRLIIALKSNITIHSSTPVRVNVTMNSLQNIELSGSGNIKITNLDVDTIQIDLPGSSNITANGITNSIAVNLSGSGNIYCDEVKAKNATVTLGGSGNITVFASDSLDAKIPGSGTIRYSGDPNLVNHSVTGSGSITP